MKCPFCNASDTKVVDTRASEDDKIVRRRRECISCHKRFTTYERYDFNNLTVVKKDKNREAFDRDKVYRGMKKSCEKRPVPDSVLLEATKEIEVELTHSNKREVDSLNVVCMDMEKKGIPGDSIRKVYAPAKEWYGNILKIKSDYVRQNPDKDVSVYVMSQLSRDQLGDAFNVLTDRVKEGMMAPLYQRMREGYEKELARDKAKEAMKPGNLAPEFTLKDLDGKNFDLSSLRGKYVVLDFWGSWCGWCIKGIPEMKKAYEKYKGKIEFVGIDCNDTEDKWKKAVAEHQLPWINVRNIGEPDVAVMYGVSGYPTKYVIDPEGKIAKQVVGEDPEFYMYLEALMK